MEYIRCPVCGKKARSGQIGRAGTHILGILTTKGLGRGKGWKHIWKEVPYEVLERLEIALQRALMQIRNALKSHQDILKRQDSTPTPIPTLIKQQISPVIRELMNIKINEGGKTNEVKETIYPRISQTRGYESHQRIFPKCRGERIFTKCRERVSVRISDMRR